ncbi:22053_t:CDS:2 [Rhizophagus irregularis]|nr:22053_t:CDS:2 [Rhizophagus irregularis]
MSAIKNLSKLFKKNPERSFTNKLYNLCNKDCTAGIRKQKVDDPILYIHWDETSFNQPNGSRDNDPTHNLQTLIDSIKDAEGDDVENKHVMFAFNTGTELAKCVRQLPQWYVNENVF